MLIPQLDVSTYPSQVFWLVILLLVHYIFSTIYCYRVHALKVKRERFIESCEDMRCTQASIMNKSKSRARQISRNTYATEQSSLQKSREQARRALCGEVDILRAKSDARLEEELKRGEQMVSAPLSASESQSVMTAAKSVIERYTKDIDLEALEKIAREKIS